MANPITEKHIEELKDEHIHALFQLQVGLPDGIIPAEIMAELDERDLVNTFHYSNPRSQVTIPGHALSEDGNKIVEEMKNRVEERKVEEQQAEAIQAVEPGPEQEEETTKSKKNKNDDKGNGQVRSKGKKKDKA